MKIISSVLCLAMVFNALPVFALGQGSPPDREYLIEPGDVISVNVSPAEEFSREVTVLPDGTVEVPLLGFLKVEGMTASELQKILAAKFSKYVANPEVKVSVKKLSLNRVAIIGKSRGTGYFEYHKGMKLLDLVAQAGGTADYARTGKVRIYRRLKDEQGRVTEEVLKADLSAVFAGDMSKNIALESGDIVYIPEKRYYSAGRWIGDNFTPWITLFTLVVTMGIISRKN